MQELCSASIVYKAPRFNGWNMFAVADTNDLLNRFDAALHRKTAVIPRGCVWRHYVVNQWRTRCRLYTAALTRLQQSGES
jgi:hypothetical protein